ncbi:MEKHLA domain-containing protein [bacterium]|nr:MEKHLA domain-containing protein [bacterium]
MKTLYVRLKRLLLSMLQSRHLVPVSTVLFVAIFLVTLLVGIENARTMRERIKRDYLDQQALLARQTTARLSEELETVKAEIRSLFRLTIISDRQEYELLLREAFLRLRGHGVVEVGLIDPTGTIHYEHEPGAEYATVDLQALERGSGHVRTQVMIDPTHTHHLTVCTWQPVPLDAGDGTLPITSYAHLDLERLSRYLMSDVHGLTGCQAWVIDRSGHYLYHPDSSLIGETVLDVHAGRHPKTHSCEFEELVAAMIAGKQGRAEVKNGVLVRRDTPEMQLFAYAPLLAGSGEDNLLGSLAFETPTKNVVSGLESLYYRQYIAEGGLLAGLLLFGLLVASYQQRMSRNLRSLVGEQDRILSGILSNSVDAVVVIDENDNIQMWNRGAQLIFGFAPEEVLGKPLQLLIPSDIDAEEELEQIHAEILEKGYVSNYTTQRLTKDGRRITVDISRTPYQSPDGSISGSTAVIKDITEKVELDQRMYNTEKLASIGLLASGVAHEINNPLTIVLGIADLMKENVPEGSDARRDLEMIEENANQAQRIVQDLLNFSRVSERVEGQTDVRTVIRKLVEFVQHTKLNGDVEITIDLPRELPPILADPRELQQVLLNLINNSIAAVDPKAGTIHISALYEDGEVIVGVHDNGRGIPEEIQPRIFDPFFTTKEVGEGTGLGLSLCYGIVRKWGGDIRFESPSTLGEDEDISGTTFLLSIPANGGEQA